MKSLAVAVFITLLSVGSPAALISCPKFCKCDLKNNNVNAKCSSQKFLFKLDVDQASVFHSLDVSNSSMVSISKSLKKLKNLQHLDLSNNELEYIEYIPDLPKLQRLSLANNRLKSLPFSIIPKSVRVLDLSGNYIKDLPKDWNTIHDISLNIQNNPVNCDEDSILKYVHLVSLKVNITDDVKCRYPKDVAGKSLTSLIAEAILHPMVGDQEENPESDEDVDNTEFIKHSVEKTETTEKSWQNDFFMDGSGEGSGDSDNEDKPTACILDCTTFKNLEIEKENNSSPLTAIKDQVGILFEDLFGKEQEEPSTTPAAVIQTEVKTSLENKVTLPTIEPIVTKKTEKLTEGAAREKDVTNLERASLDQGADGKTYYLIAVVIILMIVVAIFIVLKKRSQSKMKRRRNSLENGICEEMKPLGKYKEISNGTTNEKQNGEDVRPERVPLMNGQNGKNSELPQSAKESLEELDVTLRTPSENYEPGSSPQPERVTITAKEIPPSELKTPQLVHRQMNSVGEIITKPLDDRY